MSLSQPPIGTVVTTDPVTGLPLISSDPGIIDQIPLNSDPTALQDWGATGRPSQTLYPDSAPTVFSTVQAQHPNGIQAQSVRTDGNHAMLVKDVGGGGGGGSIQPQNYFPYMVLDDFDMTVGGQIDHSFWFPPLPTKLFGYEYGFTYNGTLGVENYFDIELHRVDGTYVTTFLHSSFLPQAAVGGNFTFSRNSVVMLPQPWDMSALLNFNTSMFVRYRCNAGEIGGYFNTWAAL